MTELKSGKLERAQIAQEKFYAPPPGQNRWERRLFAKTLKGRKIPPSITELHDLTPTDALLEENDLQTCKQELEEYEQVQEGTTIALMRYRLYRSVGIPEASIRTVFSSFLEDDPSKIPVGQETRLWLQSNPRKYQQSKGLIVQFEARVKAYKKKYPQNTHRIISDDESNEIAKDLMNCADIPVEEIFKELLRVRSERMDLIKLQIEWLEKQQTLKESSKEAQEIGILESQAAEEAVFSCPKSFQEQIPQHDFFLSGWRLFWTERQYSSDSTHLVPLPTESRTEAASALENIARGEISVKPISIIRSLEFYLHKDIIQKALATRNKYGPEGIREWVKLKRGKDRIFLYIPQIGQNVAIFFACGRDVAYRRI